MKVLLVEDSPTIVEFLSILLEQREGVELLPPAADGAAGVRAAAELAPDVILLDLELPELHGLEVIRQVHERHEIPIVVLSGHVGGGDAGHAFEALRAGAIEVLAKPEGLSPEQIREFRRTLYGVLDTAARIRGEDLAEYVSRPPRRPGSDDDLDLEGGPVEVVVVGSSTGGLPVLFDLLEGLDPPLPFPVVVAHHINERHDQGMAAWLATTGHRVELALHGGELSPGTIWVAPAGRDLALRGGAFEVLAPGGAPTPRIDVLFESAAAEYGARAAGVLLSGMGEDGALGMQTLRRAGARTLAQRGDTCVVDGMPAAARERGAVGEDLAPPQLLDALQGMVSTAR